MCKQFQFIVTIIIHNICIIMIDIFIPAQSQKKILRQHCPINSFLCCQFDDSLHIIIDLRIFWNISLFFSSFILMLYAKSSLTVSKH